MSISQGLQNGLFNELCNEQMVQDPMSEMPQARISQKAKQMTMVIRVVAVIDLILVKWDKAFKLDGNVFKLYCLSTAKSTAKYSEA